MSANAEKKILSFEQANMHNIQGLFASEGYFWLITALATAFALGELNVTKEQENQEEQEVVQLFNQTIRSGMNDVILLEAKQRTLQQIQRINDWNNQTIVFQEQRSLAISKSFTVYWLMYKLIELEWQEVLAVEEVTDTYQFLDGVLEDRNELAFIEDCFVQGKTLAEDQQIFLRSHWTRAKQFWSEMYIQLNLFASGLLHISMHT